MKKFLLVCVALVSVNSAFAMGVELSCNNGALEVTHQFDSNYGHNYVIQIKNKGIVDYFNANTGIFLNKSHLEYYRGGDMAILTSGYAKNGGFEAVMYELRADRKPDYSLPTYVKVTRRGAGALVETYLPHIGAGPNWFFESCR